VTESLISQIAPAPGRPLLAFNTETIPIASGGRKLTGRDAVAWAREAEQCGAGEILLTSMDRDGTGAGFDCELTRAIAEALHIPVIASGGGGGTQSFVDVFQRGRADAALAASIFHFGWHSLATLKQELQRAGIPVRWLC
jgi:imidazole glycerol-phosphate synthase subunit HisF